MWINLNTNAAVYATMGVVTLVWMHDLPIAIGYFSLAATHVRVQKGGPDGPITKKTAQRKLRSLKAVSRPNRNGTGLSNS